MPSEPFTEREIGNVTVQMQERINLVKVFSATRMKDRESLGDAATNWIATNPGARIVKTVVLQSSDEEFHCLSIVFFCRHDARG